MFTTATLSWVSETCKMVRLRVAASQEREGVVNIYNNSGISYTRRMSASPPILSVTQVTQAIKFCLESTFPMIWLQGEVSNCKLHTSGHLYFSLKDAGAQIGAVMYRADAAA
ncbi:MAG: exodeoxyribonuclease VII large subunit, partial [Parachlamydia sp.]|nr:exodeoxyribonuclease VII large subunit [Parachlamydia sp.]